MLGARPSSRDRPIGERTLLSSPGVLQSGRPGGEAEARRQGLPQGAAGEPDERQEVPPCVQVERLLQLFDIPRP